MLWQQLRRLAPATQIARIHIRNESCKLVVLFFQFGLLTFLAFVGLHPLLRKRADQLAGEYKAMTVEMSEGDSSFFTPEKSTRFSRLGNVVSQYEDYKAAETEYTELQGLLDDPQLKGEAEAEMEGVEEKLEGLMQSIQGQILPQNPFIDRGVILELRPGVGGSEATLFTQDLLEMYQNYANKKRWPVQLVSLTETPNGGATEAIFSIDQPGSYAFMQYEGGVHRVQRIPATETKGRVHTSTAAVVVLPQMNETDTSGNSDEAERTFETGEVRIDVMRARGAGGQHVNTTESAVRLTHIPTGIVVAMQDERSQHKNKAKAFMILRARIAERERLEKIEQEKSKRTSQVTTTSRSDKIRTYNYVQNRLTDHRCGHSSYALSDYVAGDPDAFDDVVKVMDKFSQEESLREMIAEEGTSS